MVYSQYTWIFVLSTIFAFVSAFGIGANDVANSFASSVGAKAITITQAVLIAAVCEFSGAVGLGAAVTATIKGGIANTAAFKDTPDLFLYGMFCVLIAAAFWDNMACHLELPVSTTHTTVGAVVGMTLALRGSGSVFWSQSQDEFPYFKGVTAILASWVVSPVASGILVLIIFGLIRTVVLRSEHSFDRGYYLLPVFSGATFFVIVLFIIQTGNKQASWDKVSDEMAVGISAGVGAFFALFSLVLVMPLLRRWILQEAEERERVKDTEAKGEVFKGLEDVNHVKPPTWWENLSSGMKNFGDNNAVGRVITKNSVSKLLSAGVSQDIHDSVTSDNAVGHVWENAEVFDWKTEALFRYLQVFSAMVMSFAHGSNDVANAVGPYAGIYYVYKNKKIPPSKSPVPKWIYVMGGTGIVLGLATYGHHIMRVLGVKVAKLTNARGFAAELSTATVVLISSRYGLPVSTTQTIMGAIMAIGLFEGVKGINWRVVIRTFAGWVLTLLVAGFVSAAFVSFGAFSPQKIAADDISYIRKTLLKEVVNLKNQINAANIASSTFNGTLNETLSSITKSFDEFNKTARGYTDPTALMDLQVKVLNLFNSTLVVN